MSGLLDQDNQVNPRWSCRGSAFQVRLEEIDQKEMLKFLRAQLKLGLEPDRAPSCTHRPHVAATTLFRLMYLYFKMDDSFTYVDKIKSENRDENIDFRAIKILVENGADFNHKFKAEWYDGPLFYALLNDWWGDLVDPYRGKDKDQECNKLIEFLLYAIKNGLDLTTRQKKLPLSPMDMELGRYLIEILDSKSWVEKMLDRMAQKKIAIQGGIIDGINDELSAIRNTPYLEESVSDFLCKKRYEKYYTQDAINRVVYSVCHRDNIQNIKKCLKLFGDRYDYNFSYELKNNENILLALLDNYVFDKRYNGEGKEKMPLDLLGYLVVDKKVDIAHKTKSGRNALNYALYILNYSLPETYETVVFVLKHMKPRDIPEISSKLYLSVLCAMSTGRKDTLVIIKKLIRTLSDDEKRELFTKNNNLAGSRSAITAALVRLGASEASKQILEYLAKLKISFTPRCSLRTIDDCKFEGFPINVAFSLVNRNSTDKERELLVKIIKILLREETFVKWSNSDIAPALVEVCKYSDYFNEATIGFVKSMLKLGANVNSADSKGNTALIWACDMSNHARPANALPKLLLDNGADPNAKGSKGKAINIAKRLNNEELIDMLLDYGSDMKLRRTKQKLKRLPKNCRKKTKK